MDERDATLLNDYFNRLLSAEEARAVEARAAADVDFAAAFYLRKEMETFPHNEANRAVFAELLREVGSDFFPKKQPKKTDKQDITLLYGRPLRWLAVAASIVLVAAAIWFLSPKDAPDYRQYAQHAPLALTEMGASEQAKSRAEAAFNAQDFGQALSALEEIANAEPGNLTTQFYRGICLVELGRAAEARAVFEPIAAGNSALRGEAVWYVALSYLREKNAEACRGALQKIPVGADRRAQAEELLKRLR
jgi:tetratricopeptide (TPR) repeat protein